MSEEEKKDVLPELEPEKCECEEEFAEKCEEKLKKGTFNIEGARQLALDLKKFLEASEDPYVKAACHKMDSVMLKLELAK